MLLFFVFIYIIIYIYYNIYSFRYYYIDFYILRFLILYYYIFYYLYIYNHLYPFQRVKIPRSPKHSRVVTARRILNSAGSTAGARSWRRRTWEVMWYPGTPLDLYGYPPCKRTWKLCEYMWMLVYNPMKIGDISSINHSYWSY